MDIRIEKVGLVAGISGRELTLELKKLGKEVFLIGGREDEAGSREADYFLHIDLKNRNQIYEYLKINGIQYVVLGTGHEVAFNLASYLEKKGILTSIDVQASVLAKNKTKYKTLLEEKGYLTPKYIEILTDKECHIDSVINYVGMPCVVKSPTDKQLPQKVNSELELENALDQMKKVNDDVLIEEFIDGVECTVPVVSNYIETKALLLSYYNKADRCNLSGFQKLKNNIRVNSDTEKNILKMAEDIVKNTGVIGLCRLDFIIKENKYYVLECNSVMVTGVHPNQIEYGRDFLEKEKINFAQMLVENAFKIFQQKRGNRK
jgi:carbamoylphosphate synthase large subunit